MNIRKANNDPIVRVLRTIAERIRLGVMWVGTRVSDVSISELEIVLSEFASASPRQWDSLLQSFDPDIVTRPLL